MPKRTIVQIWSEKLEKLETKRERNIDRYILPIESEIQETKDKIRTYYKEKGIKV